MPHTSYYLSLYDATHPVSEAQSMIFCTMIIRFLIYIIQPPPPKKKKKKKNKKKKKKKKQMILSHRHYGNICPVQRPINSIASGQDCSILLQHFEEESKFASRRISRQLMSCSLKWIKFCNFTKKKKKKKKKQFIDLGRMTIGSKLKQSVTSTLFKNWQNNRKFHVFVNQK